MGSLASAKVVTTRPRVMETTMGSVVAISPPPRVRAIEVTEEVIIIKAVAEEAGTIQADTATQVLVRKDLVEDEAIKATLSTMMTHPI
jgi:hypothetical protein